MQDIEQNIRFMLLEVTKQLEGTRDVLAEPSEKAIRKIENRDNYIDNMKSVVENTCFSRIHTAQLDKREIDRMRSANIIASNLERLADHAVNIVAQTRYLTDPDFMARWEYQPFFEEIFSALDKVLDALNNQSMKLAFSICLAESQLDALYKKQFDRILNELRSGMETGNLVTTLFIFRYLERIGDALLNVGEAVIFYILGEKFKIRQYNALRETLEASGRAVPISDVEFQSIWGTRSGCRIGRVRAGEEDEDSRGVIFKEGEHDKLVQERDNIALWDRIMPGLPPKVVALNEDGSSASMLIEFLEGCTLQDIVLMSENESFEEAFHLYEQTVYEIWESTKKDEPINADYIGQLGTRLEDTFRLYPTFDRPVMRIGNAIVPPLKGLLGEARSISKEISAPFSVLIHGDNNLNNIVYNHAKQRIHYIDLHRSRQNDYIQDLSVMMVSGFRLPVFDKQVRRRILATSRELYSFGREFARRHDDDTYEVRLCMGLIRSFLTSTRFELNRKFAHAMYLRGVYLLEQLVAYRGKPWSEFKMPLDVMYYL